MKKYLFGMLAIILAIGFSAFTKPAKEMKSKVGDVTVIYTYTASYDDDFVIEESDWKLKDATELSCGTPGSDATCTFDIDASFVDIGATDLLKDGLTINVTPTSGGDYRVTSVYNGATPVGSNIVNIER